MKGYSKITYKVIINLCIFFALISTLNIKVLAADNTVSSLDAAKLIVKQYYIGDTKDSVIDAASDMAGLIKSLNDPYSAYFTPQQYIDSTKKSTGLPTVIGTLMDKHIGYIAISSFEKDTAMEFKDVYKNLKNSSADSYIVDLRNNNGDYINTAFDIAGFFIGNNVVLKVQQKTGTVTSYNATDEKELIDKPVIFLTNQYSASASEVLCAAVKDYKKAIFIGERTYGKGVSTGIFALPNNDYLKLVVFKFISPLGKEINKVGITPDLQIKDNTDRSVYSLSAAMILFSNLSNNVDKSGLAQVSFAGRNYQLDLNIAKSKDNIDTFKYMVDNLFNTTNFVLGNVSGWGKSLPESGKLLPATGTPYDFSFYLRLGFIVIVAGIAIMLKGNKKSSDEG